MTNSEDSNEDAPNQRDVDDWIELIYQELKRLAARHFNREPPGHTLQPTALVHEAYLRLVEQTRSICKSRTTFFAAAAVIVHQVLVDHARVRKAKKRGGDRKRENFTDKTDPAMSVLDILALDEALTSLEKMDPRAAQVMELRHFGGLTLEEIADHLQVCERTVSANWKFAKAWLEKELNDGDHETRTL
ncbi:MAG: ECF-type sigma factor [Phycisphaerales bacterium]|nr:ECF-type sigma factor [Phycisphaerales bacterium]